MHKRRIKISDAAKIVSFFMHGSDVEINSLGYADIPSSYQSCLSYSKSIQFIKKASRNPSISCLFVSRNLFDYIAQNKIFFKAVLVTEDPESSFYFLHNYLYLKTDYYCLGKMPPKIGQNCQIHRTATIENDVVIGDRVLIGPNSIVKKGTKVGDDVGIGANTSIGVSGFEIKNIFGKKEHICHSGGLTICDGVSIGSNTVIARGLFERNTTIGAETKIDSAVHISHEVQIGKGVLICSGANLAGSCVIEDNCFLGISCILNNKIIVAKNSKVNAGAFVVDNVGEGQEVSGFYAMDRKSWLRKMIDEKRRYDFKPKET